MTKRLLTAWLCSTLVIAPTSVGQVSQLGGELSDSYYFVDHYEVVVNRSVADVWSVVVDLGSWIPGLVDATEGSPVAIEGEVFRLYGTFFVEVIKVIPERFLVMLNLPNSQDGEKTQGIAMLSVDDVEGATTVSLFMSRIFLWAGPGQSPLRARRESKEFSDERKAAYTKMLATLKQIAEAEKARSE